MDARGRGSLIVLLTLLLLSACTDKPPVQSAAEVVDAAFIEGENAWRAQRAAHLLEPDGWASLVGLHWIELKAHFIGSAADNGMRIEVGPPKLGMISHKDGQVWFTPESGVAVSVAGQAGKGRMPMYSDRDPQPTTIGFDQDKGKLTLIRRGDRLAVRTRHADAPTRLQFTGLDYWPASPSWRIQGKYLANAPGATLSIMDITGVVSDQPSAGTIEFQHDGKPYRLQAIAGSGPGLLLIFADRTSGHGSYPAGRYLDVLAPDADGNVQIDFNRAYNPPCAFTAFATCPLPPPENRLDLMVSAGEKTYRKPF